MALCSRSCPMSASMTRSSRTSRTWSEPSACSRPRSQPASKQPPADRRECRSAKIFHIGDAKMLTRDEVTATLKQKLHERFAPEFPNNPEALTQKVWDVMWVFCSEDPPDCPELATMSLR